MAPSGASAIAFTLTFAIGGRSGESFHFQNSCSSRWPVALGTHHPCPAAIPAARRQGDEGNRGGDSGDSYEDLLGKTAMNVTGKVGADAEPDQDALHQQVFANEKGFRESSVFNPARARERQEEEESRALAANWGSTPERAKDILKSTKEDKDLSFQELEQIADGLNMSDDQQRAFMLQASLKKLSSSTELPKRAPTDRIKEAVKERVFASEKGFLQNSAAFKSKLKVGSSVRVDSRGYPVMDEGDPVLQAARQKSKRASEEENVVGVSFPSLPDCPRCSTPTIEEELLQFGVCAQCKAQEISLNAYSGPQVASKYTYDNGEAPFSSSWSSPRPSVIGGSASANSGMPAEVAPTALGRRPFSSATAAAAAPSSLPAALSGDPRRHRPSAVHAKVSGGNTSPSSSPDDCNDDDGAKSPVKAATAPLHKVSGSARSTVGRRSRRSLAYADSDAAMRSPTDATVGNVVTTFSRAATTPGAGESPPEDEAKPPSAMATVNAKNSFTSQVAGSRGTVTRVPASPTASTSNTNLVPRDQTRGSGGGDSSGTWGADSGQIALRKLSLEVAELRTLLGINRAALARVEKMGSSTTASSPPLSAVVREAVSRGATQDEERRDTAVRKLNRVVTELRAQLSDVMDKVSDAAVMPPKGRGGDSEIVQNLKREMFELRSQLENARKETTLTRSALRRLQNEVDGLRKDFAAER